jgi:hypothetical protein
MYLHPHLAKIANDWNDKLNSDYCYPKDHQDFLNKYIKIAKVRVLRINKIATMNVSNI